MRKIPVFLGALLLLILGGCSSNENDSASTSKKDKDITIYMVRHGETFFNMTDQVQGFCDSQLTKNGQEQAKKLG